MAIEDLIYPFLSAYIVSPQWFKNAVGSFYSKFPISWRKGKYYNHFLVESELTDPEIINNLCQLKLQSSLLWAIQTVPFYKNFSHLIPRLQEDPYSVLQDLPLINKTDIKENLSLFISEHSKPSSQLLMHTGGSTSQPMRFYLHKGISRTKEYAYMQSFGNRIGMKQGDLILALRGRRVPSAQKKNGSLWMQDPIRNHLILSTDHLKEEHLHKHIQTLKEKKPKYIQAFPSALYPLALWLKKYPSPEITDHLKGISLFSENILDYQLELFKKIFHCPILKHYGHTERVLMAGSLENDHRYFFWPQYGNMELIDKKGNTITSPNTPGELIGTGFDNKSMSFIRYRTGDIAILSSNKNSSLEHFPVIENIEGRLQEFIICHDQRMISICAIGAAHFSEFEEINTIQYEQNTAGHLILKVTADYLLSPQKLHEIERAITIKIQSGCIVKIIQVEELSRANNGKQLLLIQHINTKTILN